MIVAVLGGTGRMGSGLAKQLSKRNSVIIGSRDPSRARSAAAKAPGVSGEGYASACRKADAAVFVVPYSALDAAAELKSDLSGKLVLSAVNPLKVQGGLFVPAPRRRSAAEELAALLPESRVATAFNNIPAGILDGASIPPIDVLVAADEGVFAEAAGVISSVDNLRPLHVGPLSQASVVEGLTALVLNIAKFNDTGSVATRFVSGKEG